MLGGRHIESQSRVLGRMLGRMFTMKLISMRCEANSLFVYEVNWKFRSEAGHETNDACYNASHKINFEARRMLVMKSVGC